MGLDEALDKAINILKECQDKVGKFAYQSGKTGKASLTGTGVLSLQIWKNAKSEEATRGLEWIVQNEAIKKDWSSNRCLWLVLQCTSLLSGHRSIRRF